MRRSAGPVGFGVVLIAATVQASSPPALSLLDAVRAGNRDAVRALVRQHTSVNVAERDGTTPLHWAVRGNDLELVTLLVRAGADVTRANRYGVRPLTLAAMNGSAAVLETLLNAGADPKTVTGGGEPVIMTAALGGSVDAVRTLAKHGADINARERWFGETALMWAASKNHQAVVGALLDLGATIDARSNVQDPPVLEFPRSGGPNAVFPRGGWTALMFAARDGAVDAARALIERGADLDLAALPQTDVALKTPEEIASADNGVGTTALVFAIINGHYDLAAMLLENGADPNVVDLSGMAALYAAVDINSLQWVQARPAPILTDRLDGLSLIGQLLAYGAEPNARLTRGPLKRHHDALSTMNFGAGTTPLMRAARTNDVEVMKLLLDAGADPLLTLPNRTTTLMLAAGVGYPGVRGDGPRIIVPTEERAVEAIQLLLDRRVDIRASNDAGDTALHGAVSRGDMVVKFVADHGADLQATNTAGHTALDLALGAATRSGAVPMPRETTAALLRQLIDARR